MADTPTTEAGKRLLAVIYDEPGHPTNGDYPNSGLAPLIAAIEAEARASVTPADVLRELRAEVEAMVIARPTQAGQLLNHAYRRAVEYTDAALAAQPEPSAHDYTRWPHNPDEPPGPRCPACPPVTSSDQLRAEMRGEPIPFAQPEPSAHEGLDVERLARLIRVFVNDPQYEVRPDHIREQWEPTDGR